MFPRVLLETKNIVIKSNPKLVKSSRIYHKQGIKKTTTELKNNQELTSFKPFDFDEPELLLLINEET